MRDWKEIDAREEASLYSLPKGMFLLYKQLKTHAIRLLSCKHMYFAKKKKKKIWKPNHRHGNACLIWLIILHLILILMYSEFYFWVNWEEVSIRSQIFKNLHQKRLLPSVRARRSNQKKNYVKKIKSKNLNPPNCMELLLTHEFPVKTSRCYFNNNSIVMSSSEASEVSSQIQQLHVCAHPLLFSNKNACAWPPLRLYVCADCKKSNPWENILIGNIALVSIKLEMMMSRKFGKKKTYTSGRWLMLQSKYNLWDKLEIARSRGKLYVFTAKDKISIYSV